MLYETGVALATAKHNLKKVESNPKGTDPSIFRCAYHHTNNFTTLGHKDCRNVAYAIKYKKKEERDVGLKIIPNERIENEYPEFQ